MTVRKSRMSVDASYLRQYNQRLILNTVYERGTTSRAELSKALSLSKPAISDNLSELLRLGVIEEAGEGAAAEKGGRKPLLLRFNANHKLFIAVDLNYTSPVVALGNLKGDVLCKHSIRMEPNASRDRRISMLVRGIGELLRLGGVGKGDLQGIAISSPGVFDAQGNLLSQNEGYGRVLWSGGRLRDALRDQYGVEILVKNDIKAATIGEWAHGAGKGEENLLYISCGVGLGAGIVLNGKLYEGMRCDAGELYYFLGSGGRGHSAGLEERICIKRLVQTCGEAVEKGVQTSLRDSKGGIGFAEIVAAYQAGDPYVRRRIRQICGELCTLAFNLGNFLSLNQVIFGGEYNVFGDMLLSEYASRYAPRKQPGARVRLAALGKYSGIHGMLYTARNAYFDSICFTSPNRTDR